VVSYFDALKVLSTLIFLSSFISECIFTVCSFDLKEDINIIELPIIIPRNNELIIASQTGIRNMKFNGHKLILIISVLENVKIENIINIGIENIATKVFLIFFIH
jgi:hypothetical protein